MFPLLLLAAVGAGVWYVIAKGRPAPLPASSFPGLPLSGVVPSAELPALAQAVLDVLSITGNTPTSQTARFAIASYEQAAGIASDGWWTDAVRNQIAITLGCSPAQLPAVWSGPNGG